MKPALGRTTQRHTPILQKKKFKRPNFANNW